MAMVHVLTLAYCMSSQLCVPPGDIVNPLNLTVSSSYRHQFRGVCLFNKALAE